MLGLMQDWPLLCHRIIEHAAAVHGSQEVVTRSVEGPIHRTNYKEIHPRPEVQIVMDMDGWGPQQLKMDTYKNYEWAQPVQFTGFKLFYKKDRKSVV